MPEIAAIVMPWQKEAESVSVTKKYWRQNAQNPWFP